MERPDMITLTTFWLDWALLPILFFLAWQTLRWAIKDFRMASKFMEKTQGLPAWSVSLPMIVCAFGWIGLGLASLIREEYYEHRVWCMMLVLPVLLFLFGIKSFLLLKNKSEDEK